MNPQLVRSTGQGLGERAAPINKAQVSPRRETYFREAQLTP